jgi:putative ABC transport system substrate-binding protein
MTWSGRRGDRVIDRRRVLVLLAAGAATAPLPARAQPAPGKVPRVGLLISETRAGQAKRIDALVDGLAERGYVDGRSVVVEVRSAESDYERLPRLAAELVDARVDVIVAFGIKALAAASRATAAIPVVIPATSGDLVALGYARSLAHPAGNVTGSTTFGSEVMAERLEILKEANPDATRAAVLVNPANAGTALTLKYMEASARKSRITLQRFDVRSRSAFDGVLGASAKAKMDGLILQDDTLFGEANAAELARLASRYRLVGVGGRDFAESGGAIGYGRLEAELYRRGAYFVDRILNGTRPGDLPIEQASRFELVVNARAAHSLGFAMPQSLLLRADRVID